MNNQLFHEWLYEREGPLLSNLQWMFPDASLNDVTDCDLEVHYKGIHIYVYGPERHGFVPYTIYWVYNKFGVGEVKAIHSADFENKHDVQEFVISLMQNNHLCVGMDAI